MVAAHDIEDEESLQAWLDALPRGDAAQEEEAQRIAVAIAHRTAMRVLPLYWRWSLSANARERDLTALPILWASLIAGVAGTCPTPAIRATTHAAADAAHAAHAAADAAAHAARAAATTHAAHAAHAASWEAIRQDCAAVEAGTALDHLPLWHDAENPLHEDWAETRTALQADGAHWQFWIDWYEAALKGTPLDTAMLTEIATTDAIDWDQAPEQVNAQIAEIVGRHKLAEVIAKTPDGEDIVVDPETDQLDAVPRQDIDGDLYGHIEGRIGKAILRFQRDCERGNDRNSVRVMAEQLETLVGDLEEDLAENKGRPLGVHDALQDAARNMRAQLEESGLSGDQIPERLLHVLDECATDLRANSPTVQDVFAAPPRRLVRADVTREPARISREQPRHGGGVHNLAARVDA